MTIWRIFFYAGCVVLALSASACSDLFSSSSASGDAAAGTACAELQVAAAATTGAPGLLCSLGGGAFSRLEDCAISCDSLTSAVCNIGSFNPASDSSFVTYSCSGATYYALSQADIAAAVEQGLITCACNPCDPSTGATCP